jgi:hypothetical protein
MNIFLIKNYKNKFIKVLFLFVIRTMNVILINVFHGGEILNTTMSVNYIIFYACPVFMFNNISFEDLRKQFMSVYICFLVSKILKLINTTQLGFSFYFYNN